MLLIPRRAVSAPAVAAALTVAASAVALLVLIAGPRQEVALLRRHTCDSNLRSARFASMQHWMSDAPWQPGVSFSRALDELRPWARGDCLYTVTGGMGHFRGLAEASQYIVLTEPAYNLKWLQITFEQRQYFRIVAAADTMAVTDNVSFRFFDNRLVVPFLNGTERFTFEPCESRISTILREPPVDTLRVIAWSAEHTKYQGTYDLCMYHEAYCVGVFKQYHSFDHCMEYISALPMVSKACGRQAPLAGLSKACKLKHKFIVPFMPNQCHHIGPAFRLNGEPNRDPDGALACNDEVDCPVWAQESDEIEIGEPTAAFMKAAREYEEWVEATWPNANGSFNLSSYKFPRQAVPPPAVLGTGGATA